MKNNLRVELTKRLLKEGLIRCLKQKPLSKISITELCEESGINRTTFYNHYYYPAMVLRDITTDMASRMASIFVDSYMSSDCNLEDAFVACLEDIQKNEAIVKVLFSANTEHFFDSFVEELIEASYKNGKLKLLQIDQSDIDPDDMYIINIANANALFALLRAWITGDLRKTPREIAHLMTRYSLLKK